MPHNYPKPQKPGKGRHRGGHGALGGNHRNDGCLGAVVAILVIITSAGYLAAQIVRAVI